MVARLLERCQQWAARDLFKPWLLISVMTLAVSVAIGLFVSDAATERLLMPCVMTIWLLFALAFRWTFYPAPTPIAQTGLRGWFKRLARAFWQRLVLLFVLLMAAVCLGVSLRLLSLLLKFYLS